MKITRLLLLLTLHLMILVLPCSATERHIAPQRGVSESFGATHAAAKGLPGQQGVTAWGVGSESSSLSNSTAKGNVLTVNYPVSLRSISVYLEEVPAGTTIEWSVYSSEAANSTYYRVVGLSESVAGGSGYFESPLFNLSLKPGTFYWLGANWSNPVRYFYSNSLPGAPLVVDMEFAAATYEGRIQPSNTIPGASSFFATLSSNAPYRFTYSFDSVEIADLGAASESSAFGAVSAGNIVTVDESMTLQSISPYLVGIDNGSTIYWAVYRSTSFDGSFTRVWDASRTVSQYEGYFESPAAMVTLEPGFYYWLGAYWDDGAYYYFSNTLPAAPLDFGLGFGHLQYLGRDGQVFDTNPGPDSFVGSATTTVAPYRQRYLLKAGAAVTPGDGDDSSSYDNDSSKGNVITVSETQTLEAIELYLHQVLDGTTLEWAVYESDTLTGPYTQVWETSRVVNAGEGYFSSGPVMLTLEAAKYYWIGGFWDHDLGYYYSNSAPGAPLDFALGEGTMSYLGRLGPYATFPGPVEFSSIGPVENAPYQQRYIFSGSQTSLFYDSLETGSTSAWSSTSP